MNREAEKKQKRIIMTNRRVKRLMRLNYPAVWRINCNIKIQPAAIKPRCRLNLSLFVSLHSLQAC